MFLSVNVNVCDMWSPIKFLKMNKQQAWEKFAETWICVTKNKFNFSAVFLYVLFFTFSLKSTQCLFMKFKCEYCTSQAVAYSKTWTENKLG